MKLLLTCGLFLLLPISSAFAQPATESPEAKSLFTKAMAQINPRHIAWIKASAQRFHNRELSLAEATKQATEYGSTLNASSQTIEALVFLVLMQTSSDDKADLKAILEQVKKTNQSKAALRGGLKQASQTGSPLIKHSYDSINNLIRITSAPANAQPLQPTGTIISNNHAQAERANKNASFNFKPVTPNEQDNLRQALNNQIVMLDAASSSMELQLQQYMDRRSKMEETISNILKKISDTEDSIIGNLK